MKTKLKTIKIVALAIFAFAFFVNLQSNIGENYFFKTSFAQTSGSEGSGGDSGDSGSGGDCDKTKYNIDHKEDCRGLFNRKIDCKVSLGNCCTKERIGEEC